MRHAVDDARRSGCAEQGCLRSAYAVDRGVVAVALAYVVHEDAAQSVSSHGCAQAPTAAFIATLSFSLMPVRADPRVDDTSRSRSA
jgi:hypothetical protein